MPRLGIAEPLSNDEIRRLLDAFKVRVRYLDDIDVAIYILPPDEDGYFGMRVSSDLGGNELRWWLTHDLAHIIAGEADEPTWEDFDDPYPHFERRADHFAAIALLHARDRAQDAEWIEHVLDRDFPIKARSWPFRKGAIAKAIACAP